MTLAISEDGGRTWPRKRNLEVGDGYCMTNNSRDQLNREYSYPVHQAGAGRRAAHRLHLLPPGDQIRPRDRGLGEMTVARDQRAARGRHGRQLRDRRGDRRAPAARGLARSPASAGRPAVRTIRRSRRSPLDLSDTAAIAGRARRPDPADRARACRRPVAGRRARRARRRTRAQRCGACMSTRPSGWPTRSCRHAGRRPHRPDRQPHRAGRAGRSQYAATKAALVGLARSWAAELAPRGITVNVVAPAATETPMLQTRRAPAFRRELPPIGRFIRPRKSPPPVAFLLSPDAGAITGQQFVICGGASL